MNLSLVCINFICIFSDNLYIKSFYSAGQQNMTNWVAREIDFLRTNGPRNHSQGGWKHPKTPSFGFSYAFLGWTFSRPKSLLYNMSKGHYRPLSNPHKTPDDVSRWQHMHQGIPTWLSKASSNNLYYKTKVINTSDNFCKPSNFP